MKIDDLTIGEAKELSRMFSGAAEKKNSLDDEFNGQYCIIRTYNAGVFFGKVVKKCEDEIILTEARRLYYWKTTNKDISLSEVANSGLHDNSEVCEPLEKHWCKAIEILPCTVEATKNIQEIKNYVA